MTVLRSKLAALLAAGLVAGGCASTPAEPEPHPNPTPAPTTAPAKPTRPTAPAVRWVVGSVTDGDTIRLRGGARVRLVQIDTPEANGGAECGGREATRALERLLPPGTRVRLVADPATDAVDRYERLLRYVYVGQRNVNVVMVAQGHASPYFYEGERGRFAAQLERVARAAKAAERGFWGSCPNAVLDAYRGVATGQLAGSAPRGGVSDAVLAAGQLRVVPAGGPDLDCGQVRGPVRVTTGDPHRLDADGDGIGCDA